MLKSNLGVRKKKQSQSYYAIWYRKNRERITKRRRELSRRPENVERGKTYRSSLKNKQRRSAYMSSYRNTLEGKMVGWRAQTKFRKIKWDLSIDDLTKIPMTCYYSGEGLTVNSNKPNTVSLDRINNKKGYVQGNVVFCSWRINSAKIPYPKKNL